VNVLNSRGSQEYLQVSIHVVWILPAIGKR